MRKRTLKRVARRILLYVTCLMSLSCLLLVVFLHDTRNVVTMSTSEFNQESRSSSKSRILISGHGDSRINYGHPGHSQVLSPKPLSLSPSSSWNKLDPEKYFVPKNKLLDMDNFKLVKNSPQTCQDGGRSPFLVAIVHSAPRNFHKRQIVRQTWALKNLMDTLNFKLVFILGLSSKETDKNKQEENSSSSSLASRIDHESRTHGDIVQGNFIDTYRNLTYKHLTGYKWILENCNNTQFVMKADDDAFIDIEKVISTLKSMFENQEKKNGAIRGAGNKEDENLESSQKSSQRPAGILACSLFPEGTMTRRSGKWALSKSEFPSDTYPAYCSGIAYFVTPDVILKLYHEANTNYDDNFIWIDDLFVTGILATAIGQPQLPLNFKYSYEPQLFRSWLASHSNYHHVHELPYIVGDIGDAPDWTSLMRKLYAKSQTRKGPP